VLSSRVTGQDKQNERLGLLGFLEPKEGEMITVTERAAAGLEEMLRVNNAEPGQGVKLVPTGVGSIGMTIDTPAEGDEVIPTGAEATLIVDSRVAEDLDGVIDCDVQVIEGEAQTTFKLRPAA
jgi:Fe-S cluster assembly iron-binding protein IscA